MKPLYQFLLSFFTILLLFAQPIKSQKLIYVVTTVRDCASDLGFRVLAWRDEINAGRNLEG